MRQEADSRDVVDTKRNERFVILKMMKMIEKWWQKRRNECFERAAM